MKRGVKQSSRHNNTASSKQAGIVRIISGRFRGRKLPVLDVQGLRPTTDKNKEMLFNWLMPYIQNSTCLDAFAGSGGLGFEALSRYAKSCTFVELDKQAAKSLAENINLLKLTSVEAKLVQGSVLATLKTYPQTYDLIFVDPPFHQNLVPQVVNKIMESDCLTKNGIIYIECETQGANYAIPHNWHLLKEKRASLVISRVYQRVE
jgi:16S rRNA (guanine966-N2)-methyltransferase